MMSRRKCSKNPPKDSVTPQQMIMMQTLQQGAPSKGATLGGGGGSVLGAHSHQSKQSNQKARTVNGNHDIILHPSTSNNSNNEEPTDKSATLGAQNNASDEDDEDIWVTSTIPLPIQTFLWRQTSPFIRPRLARLQDAAAMEQREACKLFEKVLVQNIQFGLSPGLTEAIHSVSRWKMIVAALPHVMHCCAALLYARRKSCSFDKLSASETKLLYTLHWILLDAAEECADAEAEKGIRRRSEHYLLPISTIQTFMYLFAPLIPQLKQSDFLASFRLENGHKIWIPLFHYCHPEIPSFIAPAKKDRRLASTAAAMAKLAATKFGDVFIGSSDRESAPPDGHTSRASVFPDIFAGTPTPFDGPSGPGRESPSKETFGEMIPDPKRFDNFVEKDLATPLMATYLDVSVLRCIFTAQWLEEGIEWALSYLDHRLDVICKWREQENQRKRGRGLNDRARSSSLPATKRVHDEFRPMSDMTPQQPTALVEVRPPTPVKSNQLKTNDPSQQRRSSFSGLPGLAGFQALISSTQSSGKSSTSSSAFGRHGSEKVKHKKPKKMHDPLSATKSSTSDPSRTKIKSGRESAIRSKMTVSGVTKPHPSSIIEVQPPEEELNIVSVSVSPQRPLSALSDTLESAKGQHRKVSLVLEESSSSPTHRLLDKQDHKGKSMPSLHLIEDSGVINCSPNQLSSSSVSRLSPSINRVSRKISPLSHTTASKIDASPPAFPIITITEHSPVNSSRQLFDNRKKHDDVDSDEGASAPKGFYIGGGTGTDDDGEQSPKSSLDGSAGGSRLQRAKSDSDIRYSAEDANESPASIHYVNSKGQLSLLVILKAIHSITLRDNVCSTPVCKVIFKIVNRLLAAKLIPIAAGEFYRDIAASSAASGPSILRPRVRADDLSMHHLFVDTTVRLAKQLGCARGCGEGRRDLDALKVRDGIVKTLKNLHDISPWHFTSYCEMLVTTHSLQEVIDVLHAFLGFCSDFGQVVVPLPQFSSTTTTAAAGATINSTTKSKSGSSMSTGGGKTRAAVEGIIVKSVFVEFISRLVDVQRDLKVQENMSLYCEIRQFINYVRNHHAGIFRSVAMSGLMEITKWVIANEVQISPSKSRPDGAGMCVASSSGPASGLGASHHATTEAATVITSSSSHSTLINVGDFNERLLAKLKKSGGADFGYAGSAGSPVLDDNDSLAGGDRERGAKHKPFKHWFHNKHNGKNIGATTEQGVSTPGSGFDMQSESGSLHNFLTIYPEPGSEKLIRRGSFSRQTLKNYSAVNPVVMTTEKSKLSKARLRMGQIFGKGPRKQTSSFEDTPDFSRKNSLDYMDGDERDEMTLENGVQTVVREPIELPVKLLRDGMLRFQFLLEACTPGTIPDAQLVAAMLDLKAPVLARAAFLLECSNFVHRCNRGQWPLWMRVNFNFFRPAASGVGSRGSQSVVKNRASTTQQRAAGRAFYQWADLLSSRLEDMMRIEIELAEDTQGEGSEGRRSKQSARDDEDDPLEFLHVDQSCPPALKMIACQLLFEITTFLRETHQYLPAKTSRRPSIVTPAPQTATLSVAGQQQHQQQQQQHPQQSSQHPLSTASQPHRDRLASIETRPPHNQNRRWSMAINMPSLPGHSLIAGLSGSGSGGGMGHFLNDHHHNDQRRISFVLHEAETENESNSTTSNDDLRRFSQVGTGFLRRSTGFGRESIRRRSIKLKNKDNKATKLRSTTLGDDSEFARNEFQRSNSLRSRRKASGVSQKSDISDRLSQESLSVLSDADQSMAGTFEVPDTLDASDEEIVANIPWLKIPALLEQTLDLTCQHRRGVSCSLNCYKRVIKSTSALVCQVRRVYDTDETEFHKPPPPDYHDAVRHEKKLKKIATGNIPLASPLRRKPSIPVNLERAVYERAGDSISGTQNQPIYSSQTALAQHTVGGGNIDIEKAAADADCEDPRMIFAEILAYRENIKTEQNCTLLYLVTQARNPFHSVVSMMLKSVLVLKKEQFETLFQISWNLILDEDAEISAAASVAVVVCALKASDIVVERLLADLQSTDLETRLNALRKFQQLWNVRYQVWQRLEDGAQQHLKLPPAAIEFTLPSPRIALECKPVVDPPYMPVVKTKLDDVAINQEPTIQKSFVAATKTRRKQQIELVARALQDQDDKLREERENYTFHSVPVTLQASYEPALFHQVIDDHAPINDELDDDADIRVPVHHLQVAQCFFPTSLATAAMTIVSLLEDTHVESDVGNSVYELAYKTIWKCLIEDPALFLRHLFERLTREKKSVIIQTIRRLLRFVPRLPAQAAYTIYNALTGFIMHHVRSPSEDSQDIIATTMSVIWLIVPNVYGLFLKDLKQILRKEQCDATILITANVPSAKKIVVHGPDASLIPSQFPVHEDTQFSQILTDALDFFGIDESKHNEYFLVDAKTNQIHNLNAFVRDFYFFKRSQYPQISLVHMDPHTAFDKFQRQAFTLQYTELGKCLMSLSLIKTSFLGIQRVLFLHEELMKLPSFPRKALETNLTLYSGPMGKEVLGIDTLHKVSWVRLVSRMFEVTSGFFAEAGDLHLFLNVVNGALLLHCEDASILRLCMSTYINAAHQFKNIFATNGYLLMVQPMVQIYANHQTNSLLCKTIEFVFKQFYILHRKPFVLQMFGAVAPLLDTEASASASHGAACQIHPRAFFQLLQSLGQYTADPLDILELVDAEKPLKALDFCYQMDSEAMTILDAISLCVTVISYASDSERGHQMLKVLDAILPYHLRHQQVLTTKKETPGGPRAELAMIHNISVCMKTLIYNCEALSRNYTGPQKPMADIRDTSFKTGAAVSPNFIEIDEDSHSKYEPNAHHSYYSSRANNELDDGELSRMDFRVPRDLLLKTVSEFLTRSTARLHDLSKKIPDLHHKNTSVELLDVKCHLRLAEIAHSLLKLAPYDPATMASKGLVRYMNEILPASEWRQEQMRPALIMVLRRLDKTFAKIAKKSAIKRATDWEAARRLLKGVYLTFIKHPYIVHLPHLKSLISVCQSIILGDIASGGDSGIIASQWTAALSQAPPPGFTSVAVRLISLQMIQLGDTQTLETLCSGVFASPEKSEIFLMNMIYPMGIRTVSGLKDIPKSRQCDINFILSIILNILKPISGSGKASSGKGSDSSGGQAAFQLKQFSLQQIGLLGLKICIICYEKQLTTEWYRIGKCIRDLAEKPHLIGVTFWNFLEFICTYRTPLFVLMLPYVKRHFLTKTPENDAERVAQIKIREKLAGRGLPMNRSKGSLLVMLVTELKNLREEIIRRKNNPNYEPERSRSIMQEPNSNATAQSVEINVPNSMQQPSSSHRLSFAFGPMSSSKMSASNSSNTMAPSTNAGSGLNLDAPQVIASPSAHTKSILLRGLSFRLGTDSRRLASRGLSVKMAPNTSDKRMYTRRTSVPDNPEAQVNDKDSDSLRHSAATSSEPRLNRRPTAQKSQSQASSNQQQSPTRGMSPEFVTEKDALEQQKKERAIQRQKAASTRRSLRAQQRREQRHSLRSQESHEVSDNRQFGSTTSSLSGNSLLTSPQTHESNDTTNGNVLSIPTEESSKLLLLQQNSLDSNTTTTKNSFPMLNLNRNRSSMENNSQLASPLLDMVLPYADEGEDV